ncbi:relaxase/mobilization nuclease domain-containing protein [Aminobacterium colombiense]|jgi:hypothetical protein|uniref:relaxase/mobilization nuclease domain-containing protein n=1 Tax=Aminobacterium colombiense TaxID=81468 RepID=UPI0025949C79|nr:relaxase/mobilization nuclease domain-containing protein [uncultured Aminobacterium sp.]
MAVTKIHAIKSTVNKALKYILDPNKTDGTLLSSGFHCEPITAHLDFQMTANLAEKVRGGRSNTGGADNLAYHLIQSFAKTDKIAPEEAHAIGTELANELFQGKHEYVITTHIDKDHIHNHILVNAVSFVDFGKLRTRPYETVRQIREISDKLCRARGLHVIDMPQGKGKESKKWHTQPSWRDRLQLAVDKAIYTATNYQEFSALLQKQNIEVKEGKHIAFKMPGQQRYIRGKSIGPRYEREQILTRIAAPNKGKVIDFLPHTKIEKAVYRKSSAQIVRDIQRTANALVLTRKENVYRVGDYALRLDELKAQCDETRETIKELENKNALFLNVTRSLITYHKYLPLAEKYEQLPIGKKRRFFAANEPGLRLFGHAKDALSRDGITPKDPTAAVEALKAQVDKVNALQEQYKAIEGRIGNLSQARDIIMRIIGQSREDQREKEKGRQRQENVR